MQHFTDAQVLAQINAALEEEPDQKILAFLCNWCSYAGADLAGLSRLKYPANTRFIRVMCSGRVDESFILWAFEKGAPVCCSPAATWRLPLHQCQSLGYASCR